MPKPERKAEHPAEPNAESKPGSKKKPWWSEGIRFECQGMGCCCTCRGKYNYVYLTAKDRRRMAEHLKLPTWKFTRTYCGEEDGFYFLKDIVKSCSFLTQKGCTVYEARPTQCRTWPFWPENMDRKTWEKEVVPFCKGIGKGRLYSAEEIRKILQKQID